MHKDREKEKVRRKIGMQTTGTQNELRYPLLDRVCDSVRWSNLRDWLLKKVMSR